MFGEFDSMTTRLTYNRIRGGIQLIGFSLLLGSVVSAFAQPPLDLSPAQRARLLRQRQMMAGQRKVPPAIRPGNRPAVQEFRRNQARRIDPEAVRLLQRMARPMVDFSGEQVTEVAERSMETARLRVWGDRRGRVRHEYLEPDALEGDVMLVSLDQYRYFHRKRNVLDVALWPTPTSAREQRILQFIKQNAFSVQKVGGEVIAGRNAAIVAVAGPGGPNAPGRQMKFWIDTETGVQLKNEISNASGLVSRSYMTSIQFGSEANMTPQLFEPRFLNTARLNPLFPPEGQFADLEAARDRLPFTPMQPASLPSGYKLTGVWVFGPEQTAKPGPMATVLLRYSDGVGSFSLYQRRPQNAGRPIAARKTGLFPRRSIQHWFLPNEDGGRDVVYIGHLTPELVAAIYNSLR